MNYKFHSEQPAATDQFKGKNHENVANAIAKIFKSDSKVHLVGLEGELGSGKSTVIQILKKKLVDTSYIEFDVERHHHGSIKRAFIEEFGEKLVEMVGSSKSRIKNVKSRIENVNRIKNEALGNTLSYEKNIKSNISWWVIFFIISIIFSTQAVKPVLKIYNGPAPISANTDVVSAKSTRGIGVPIVSKTNQKSPHQNLSSRNKIRTIDIIWWFILLSPVFLVLFMWIGNLYYWVVSCGRKKPKAYEDNKITVGDLFKRNGMETITEKMLITREIGSVELSRAMQKFMLLIPKNIQVVLIIDNLDRVQKNKVKEIWSDLEIFTSVAGEKLKIILPYSRRHVAHALSGSQSTQEEFYEGEEFIAKRIPVSFRVPPVVSAGWQEAFKKFWLEVMPEGNEEEIQACSYLLDLWLPQHYNNQVTPRLLKRFINDIISLLATTPLKVSPVVVVLYVIAVRYDNQKIEELLQSQESLDEMSKNDNVFKNKIESSQKKVKLCLSGEGEEWETQLMCIHYQTTAEVAISEMLIQPLSRALKQGDIDGFFGRRNVFGFFKVCSDLISPEHISDIIKILSLLHENDEEYFSKWVESHLNSINYELRRVLVNEARYDERFLKSISKLVGFGIDIDLQPLSKIYKNRLNMLYSIEPNEMFDHIDALYRYSMLLNKNPFSGDKLDGKFYAEWLWPNSEKWAFWDIGNIWLNEEKIKEALDYLFTLENKDLEEVDGADLYYYLTSMIELGFFDLPNWSGKRSARPALKVFNRSIPSLSDLRQLPFDHCWYSSDLMPRYFFAINDKATSEYRDELLAQACAHLIQTEKWQYISTLVTLLDPNPRYKDHLSHYLTLVKSFTTIVEALKQDALFVYISDSVKELIVNQKVQNINIVNVVVSDFEFLNKAVKDSKLLINWLSAWDTEELYKDIKLQEFHSDYFFNVMDADEEDEVRLIFEKKLNDKDLTMDYWVQLIEESDENVRKLVQYMGKQNKYLDYFEPLSDAITYLFGGNCTEEEILVDPPLLNDFASLIKDNERNKLYADLSHNLYTKTIPDICKQASIVNFNMSLELPPPTGDLEQESIVRLFDKIGRNTDVADWLDQQQYSFSNWKDENLIRLAEVIKSLEDEKYTVLREAPELEKHLVKDPVGDEGGS